MRELLEASSQRMIKIMEILMWKDDWTATRELAATLGVSERTISTDISNLRARWNQYIDVETSPNGIRMHNRTVPVMGMVFSDIFNDSTALRWIEKVFFCPNQNIKFYEKALFVSESTLIRLIPKIDGFLSARGINFQHNNNRYQIVSENELYLRQFLSGFLIELHKSNFNEYTGDFDFSILSNIIKKILRQPTKRLEQNFVLSGDIAIVYLHVFYIVSLVRENHGFTMKSPRVLGNEITDQNFRYIKTHFQNITKENLQPIHEFIFYMYSMSTEDEKETLLLQETGAFFDRICEAAKIPVPPDTLIILKKTFIQIYKATKCRTYRTSALFDRVYYFSLSLKAYNLSFYKLIEENLALFAKNLQINLSSILPEVMFWLCLDFPDFNKFVQTKTALLISDFGIQHANFAAKVISNFINHGDSSLIEIKSIRYQGLLESTVSSMIEKYDIIITTVPNLPTFHKTTILIDDYPSPQNLYEIYKAVRLS